MVEAQHKVMLAYMKAMMQKYVMNMNIVYTSVEVRSRKQSIILSHSCFFFNSGQFRIFMHRKYNISVTHIHVVATVVLYTMMPYANYNIIIHNACP